MCAKIFFYCENAKKKNILGGGVRRTRIEVIVGLQKKVWGSGQVRGGGGGGAERSGGGE